MALVLLTCGPMTPAALAVESFLDGNSKAPDAIPYRRAPEDRVPTAPVARPTAAPSPAVTPDAPTP